MSGYLYQRSVQRLISVAIGVQALALAALPLVRRQALSSSARPEPRR